MVTPPIISRTAALTGKPETAQICDSFLRSASVSRTEIMCVLPGISPSFPAALPQNLPPAGGIGDWGKPQQARLSYKRYACASAAHGGVLIPAVGGAFFER